MTASPTDRIGIGQRWQELQIYWDDLKRGQRESGKVILYPLLCLQRALAFLHIPSGVEAEKKSVVIF